MYRQRSGLLAERSRGAVMIEFLLLFPFIVAIMYGAAYYSVLFSWQYRMQGVADRVVSEAVYLDRRDYGSGGEDLQVALQGRAEARLAALKQGLPATLQDATTACQVKQVTLEAVGEIAVLDCSLSVTAAQVEGGLPQVSFGWLGTFPPTPGKGISASSQVAF